MSIIFLFEGALGYKRPPFGWFTQTLVSVRLGGTLMYLYPEEGSKIQDIGSKSQISEIFQLSMLGNPT